MQIWSNWLLDKSLKAYKIRETDIWGKHKGGQVYIGIQKYTSSHFDSDYSTNIDIKWKNRTGGPNILTTGLNLAIFSIKEKEQTDYVYTVRSDVSLFMKNW